MPKAILAVSIFAAALAASLSPAMARDACLRQGWRPAPGMCAYQDYAPCRGPNCYYSYRTADDLYDDWGTIRRLKAGIPGNPDAGGGPTGANQATNRPNASNEIAGGL